MRTSKWIWNFLIVAALAFRGTSLDAQSTKVELSGLIRDPAALPVEGAEVRLLNVSTQAEQSSATGPDGGYHFFALQPGTYTITVTKTGFTTLRRDGLALRVGDQVSLDLPLQIGDVDRVRERHRRGAFASVQPRHGEFRRRAAEGRDAAAGRPQLHSADRALSRRHAASGFDAAAHQRQPASRQRIHL